MRKSLKRILAIALTTISIFAIVGCGQSDEQTKEKIKDEIKQEIKDEEEQKKVDEVKEVTKESLQEFETLYAKYPEDMAKALGFTRQEGHPDYVTVEQGKEIKSKTADVTKASLIKATPEDLKDIVNKYLEDYEKYFALYSEGKQGDETKVLTEDLSECSKIIKEKIARLHTLLG